MRGASWAVGWVGLSLIEERATINPSLNLDELSTPLGSSSLASQVWSSCSHCSVFPTLIWVTHPRRHRGQLWHSCLPSYCGVKKRSGPWYILPLGPLGNSYVPLRNNQPPHLFQGKGTGSSCSQALSPWSSKTSGFLKQFPVSRKPNHDRYTTHKCISPRTWKPKQSKINFVYLRKTSLTKFATSKKHVHQSHLRQTPPLLYTVGS